MDLRTTSVLQLLLTTLGYFSARNCGCCAEAGQALAPPDIVGLRPFYENQSLVLSWRAHQGAQYEVQAVNGPYSNETARPAGDGGAAGGERLWGWTSPLPLECADHSVRVRRVYDDDADDITPPSPWSPWRTNYALHREPVIKMFPPKARAVMLAGRQAILCCIPPPGANITRMNFTKEPHRLISLGDGIMAIMVNVTIPAELFKRLLFQCEDSNKSKVANSYIYPSIPPDMPRNLSCYTTDLKRLTCGWDPGKKDHLHKMRNQTLFIE